MAVTSNGQPNTVITYPALFDGWWLDTDRSMTHFARGHFTSSCLMSDCLICCLRFAQNTRCGRSDAGGGSRSRAKRNVSADTRVGLNESGLEFYARPEMDGPQSETEVAEWFWNGNSWHAFDPLTRRQFGGPFCGHVSGSLVMKELKRRWTHWHSNSQSIVSEVLNPTNPDHTKLAQSEWWRFRASAETLEKLVRRAIERWADSRLNTLIDRGTKRIPSANKNFPLANRYDLRVWWFGGLLPASESK